MADNINQGSSGLNGAVAQPLSNGMSVDEVSIEQADTDIVHEEVLHHFRQALADANSFDSTVQAYSVDGKVSRLCDASQGAQNGEIFIAEVENEECNAVENSESILQRTSEVIFSDEAQDSMLTNDTSGVLDIDTNASYAVETIPEGHVISIPSDMISDSAIVMEDAEDHSQTSLEISEPAGVRLLQEVGHQQLDIVEQPQPNEFVQHNTEVNTPQSNSHTKQEVLQSGSFPQARHAITLSAPSGISMTPEVLQSVLEQVQAQHLIRQQEQNENLQPIQVKEEPCAMAISTSSPGNFTVVSLGQSTATTGGAVTTTATMVTPVAAPPLGSSQNPIRIIQQGNRYTPMQQLSTEQLQQIMQVVQQQHVSKTTQDTSGAIIFNPQTNTRIMYRVIYPSELHKSQTAGGQTTYQVLRPAMATQEQQTGMSHQKRQYRRKKDLGAATDSAAVGPGGEQEEKERAGGEGPELSREEKEERKKHRPRTRSGRVSKPPKHMVQDYKHIHVLDWDEDYDDSDGGYSDFKHSDEEGKIKQEGTEEDQLPRSPDLFSGLGAIRPKNHKCQTCDKSYIGQAGLARHYRLNPDHCVNPSEDGSASSLHNGSIDGDENSKDTPLAHDSSLSRLSDSALDTTATPCGPNSGSTNLETFSEDSNTQDSLNSTEAPSPHAVLAASGQRGRGRGRFRGRWAHLKQNAHMRRKNKLKELIKECNDEELMEAVLPRLATSISLWEFLMMKSERGGARPQVDVMYHEFEILSKHVRQACASYLKPLSEQELTDDSLQCKMIKVCDKKLGACLDLEPVTYRVREMPPGDCNAFSSFHTKLSAVARAQQDMESAPLGKSLPSDRAEIRLNGGQKRSLESILLTEDELHNSAKRPKISTLPIPTAVSPGLFSVKAHLPLQGNGVEEDSSPHEALSSDPSEFFSSTSQASLSNHATVQVVVSSQHLVSSTPSNSLLSSVSIPLSSSCVPSMTRAITTSAGSSTKSPYVHISSPSAKQQTGLNHNPAFPTPVSLTQNLPIHSVNSTNQTKPRVMAVAVGGLPTEKTLSCNGNGVTASSLPSLITGASLGLGGQRFVLAGPSAQTLLAQQGAGPGTALLLAAGAAAGNHRILVRHPPPVAATSPRQAKPSKNTPQAAGPPGFTSLLAASSSTNPVSVIQPTEVKVSRQLFHHATQSSSSSLLGSSKPMSLLTNGKAPVSSVLSAPHQAQVTASPGLSTYILADAPGVNNQITTSKPVPVPEKTNNRSKTLETPPSGQQFVTSPNKTASTASHVGMSVAVGAPPISDMDVMGLGLPAVEDMCSSLGPTPTDSFNDSFASSSPSVVTTMVAGSHFLNHASGGSVADSVLSYHKPIGDVFGIPSQNAAQVSSNSDLPYSLPNQNIATSTSVHSNQKSPVLSTVKVKARQAEGESVASSNDTLFSQTVKTDNTSVDTNLSEFQFSTQTQDLPPQRVSDQFANGTLTSMEHSTVLSSELDTVDSALPEEMPLNNHLTEEDMEQGGIPATAEGLVSSDGSQQLLLSEGTNIYQTEDGIFIDSADGNTYQLQGGQELSVETVQALLSGTLDQLAT